jgi:Flp pilus assembly pilin Flp
VACRPPERRRPRSVWPRPSGAVELEKGVGTVTFWRADDGQGLVEYALIIAVIAIAVIVAMLFFRDQLSTLFSNIGNNLT